MPDRWPPALEIPRALNDDPAFHAAAPDAYVCALTREVMKNPAVVGRTGRSYERAAIDAWIARHGRDPVATSVKVTREDAAPNRAVRASIERYVARETARRARGAATANEGANEDANEDANETDDEEDDEEDETSDGE